MAKPNEPKSTPSNIGLHDELLFQAIESVYFMFSFIRLVDKLQFQFA